MKTIHYLAAIGAMAGLVAFTGCKTTEEAGEETGEAVEEVAEETEEVAAEVAEETVEAADEAEDIVDTEATANIAAVAGSGISGNTDLSLEGDQARIEVELQGAPDPAVLTGMIHEGACASPGTMVLQLGAFVAGGAGPENETTFPASLLTAGQSYAVVIHDQSGAIVACGALPEIDRG